MAIVKSAVVACVTLALLTSCKVADKPASAIQSTSAGQVPASGPIAATPGTLVQTAIGFRSSNNLDEHFAKHGAEFRGMSKSRYLLAAQTLRDSPVGGDIEEIVRADGVASRFDKASGAFIAFNRDGTIRTFFKPNDGESYFRRQAQRSH